MILRILLCIFFASLTLYGYVNKQNDLTEVRIAIPVLEKQVKQLCVENQRLRYEVDRLRSPERLLQLAAQPQFGHLHYPQENEVLVFPLPPPLEDVR